MSTIETNRSWTNFRGDRRNPRYCHVTFDHPPINAITAIAVAELSDLVGLIEKLNHFRPCNSTKSKVRLVECGIRRHSGCFCRCGECRRIFPDELLHAQRPLPR